MSHVLSGSGEIGSELPSPESAFENLQRLFTSANVETLDDRRIEERVHVFHRLVLQTVYQDLSPVGPSIEAVSRDVSLSGLGWISTVPLVGPLIRVTMFHAEEECPVFIKMTHQHKVGPVFMAGGPVVVDWSESVNP